MGYRVHQVRIDVATADRVLEAFLNGLEGEVVSVVPNLKRTSFAQIYGWTNKVDHLLVVERVA